MEIREITEQGMGALNGWMDGWMDGENQGQGGVASLGSPVAPPGGAACVAAG